MEPIKNKVNKVVELVQDRNLDTKEAIELVKNCKMDNEGQLYNPNTGETVIDVEAMTVEQVEEFLKSV